MVRCRDLSSRHRTGGGYRGGQASIRSGGDVPDWDNTESRERDEDAAWRDLVARFDAPLTEQQPVPWPAREDMAAEPAPEADSADGPDEARGSDGKHRGPEAGGLDAEPGRHGRLGADGAYDPEVIQVPRRIRGPVTRGVPTDGTLAEDEEHFIPPAP